MSLDCIWLILRNKNLENGKKIFYNLCATWLLVTERLKVSNFDNQKGHKNKTDLISNEVKCTKIVTPEIMIELQKMTNCSIKQENYFLIVAKQKDRVINMHSLYMHI